MYGTSSTSVVNQPLLGRSRSAVARKARKARMWRGDSDATEEESATLFQQHRLAYEEELYLKDEYGEDHWKLRLYHVLHSHRVILALALLMLLDVLFLIIGLVLDGTYPECAVILSRMHCSSCMIVLTEEGEKMSCGEICEDPPLSIEQLKLFLTTSSICILLLFLVELFLHLSVLGIKGFVKNAFLVLDLIVVLVSLWLEALTTLKQRNREASDDVEAFAVPLLIVSRSWRLLRIGHGAYMEARELYERELEDTIAENEMLKERLVAIEGIKE